MILQGKKILVMGIRNKWSIAWGVAKKAEEQGAELIFTYSGMDSKEKIEQLISEIPNSKAYLCNVDTDEEIEKSLKEIKNNHGKIDGILHSIAHAFTQDLHDDFIQTSREGYLHAIEISSYSFVAIARIAKQIELLNDNASLVSLTYYGSEKVMEGYNVMGVAKAALEASVRYLSQNLGKEKIRVNAISAGPIKTLSAKGIKDFGSILDVVEQKAPLKANVTQNQVGDVAAFLFSNLSSAITGEIIHVDNGFNIMGA